MRRRAAALARRLVACCPALPLRPLLLRRLRLTRLRDLDVAVIHDEEDLLLDNFEVIQNLDDYEKAGSFEFLDALSHDSNLLKRMGGGRAVP